MRIIVMSDSHGNFSRVRKIVEEHRETAQSFLHLGDGLDEFDDVHRLYPDLHFVAVKGNNDWGSLEQKTKQIVCGGKNVMLTHGDLHNVKLSLLPYKLAAKEARVDIALYGHTHYARCDYADGLHIINPGSVMSGSYLVLDITPSEVVPELINIS